LGVFLAVSVKEPVEGVLLLAIQWRPISMSKPYLSNGNDISLTYCIQLPHWTKNLISKYPLIESGLITLLHPSL
jgi:hypothetical protein